VIGKYDDILSGSLQIIVFQKSVPSIYLGAQLIEKNRVSHTILFSMRVNEVSFLFWGGGGRKVIFKYIEYLNIGGEVGNSFLVSAFMEVLVHPIQQNLFLIHVLGFVSQIARHCFLHMKR